jgi:hypothetical protein
MISSTFHLPPPVFHSISHLHSTPSWPTLFSFQHLAFQHLSLSFPHRSLISSMSSLDQSCPVTSSFVDSPYPCLVTAHPPLPIICPSLRTSLHALSIRLFNQSRWQCEKDSTFQECRVGWVVPNPMEEFIEVVGGG